MTTSFTALSIPLLISTALAPLAKCCKPSLIISLANKVDVVVPSPALSAVFIDATLTKLTPKFSTGLLTFICFATVTPSFVDIGDWLGLSITTFLPLGPNVDTTALANVSIPFTNLFLPSGPNSIILLIFILLKVQFLLIFFHNQLLFLL